MGFTIRLLLITVLVYLTSCKKPDSPPEEDKAQTVYVANSFNNTLFALDAETGNKKWETITSFPRGSSPTVANGVVYIGGDKLYAIDAATGIKKWEVVLGTPEQLGYVNTIPTVANGLVYVCVGGAVNKLFAIDANTGNLKWEFATGGFDIISPTVFNDLVYVGIPGKIFALDALSGSKKWEVTNLLGGLTNPSVVDGVVYTNCGSHLYAHDALTGREKWRSDFAGVGTTTVENGLLFLNSGRGGLLIIDAATGKYIREYRYCTDNLSYPVVDKNLVYVGSGGCRQLDNAYTFQAVDAATGALKWSQKFEWSTTVSPAVASGTVFVGTYGVFSKMYALDALTGVIKWGVSLGSNTNNYTSACIITRQGKIYTAANSGDQQ